MKKTIELNHEQQVFLDELLKTLLFDTKYDTKTLLIATQIRDMVKYDDGVYGAEYDILKGEVEEDREDYQIDNDF